MINSGRGSEPRAPDAGMRTLHVRCGSDIRDALREAGFAGEFLEYSDPVCQGPVPDTDELIDIRARFVARAYRYPRANALRRLRGEQLALHEARERYERIVLWFEHDAYDQLVLARALDKLEGGDAQVELICIDRFPGVERFIGLGQLSPAQLRSLWPQRRPVDAAMFSLGRETWQALRADTPLPLHRIASSGTPALPQLAPALERHLQELPWRRDGLSLTQRLVLQSLAGGPVTAGAIFATMTRETEPLPFLGDLMLWGVLEEMLDAGAPPFELADGKRTGAWHRRRLALTETGRRLLDAKLDWLELRPPERWVGGVRIDAPQTPWRWCGASQRPVRAAGSALE